MKCADVEKLIALDVEGDLPAARATALRRHLAACPACEQFAHDMRESQQVLKSLRQEMLEESILLAARVAALETLRTQPRVRGWEWTLHPRLRWTYAACGLAVLAWAAIRWMGLHRNQQPPAAANTEARQGQEVVAKADPGATQPLAQAASPNPGGPFLSATAARPDRRAANRQPVENEETGVGDSDRSSSEVVAPSTQTPLIPDPGAAVTPRVQIVAVGQAGDPSESGSSATVLKIASHDPNVLLYWVMDSQGGS